MFYDLYQSEVCYCDRSEKKSLFHLPLWLIMSFRQGPPLQTDKFLIEYIQTCHQRELATFYCHHLETSLRYD